MMAITNSNRSIDAMRQYRVTTKARKKKEKKTHSDINIISSSLGLTDKIYIKLRSTTTNHQNATDIV